MCSFKKKKNNVLVGFWGVVLGDLVLFLYKEMFWVGDVWSFGWGFGVILGMVPIPPGRCWEGAS